MYKTLKKLKGRISYSSWLKMVENAFKNGKLTQEEYDNLLKEDDEDEWYSIWRYSRNER